MSGEGQNLEVRKPHISLLVPSFLEKKFWMRKEYSYGIWFSICWICKTQNSVSWSEFNYRTQVAVRGFENPEFLKFLEFSEFLNAKKVTSYNG